MATAPADSLTSFLEHLPQLLLQVGLCESDCEAEIVDAAIKDDSLMNLSSPVTTTTSCRGHMHYASERLGAPEGHDEGYLPTIPADYCSCLECRENDLRTITQQFVKSSENEKLFEIHRQTLSVGEKQAIDDEEPTDSTGDLNCSESIVALSGDVEDDDELYIHEGECELCERGNIRLTRHHLIPKSSWSRVESVLLSSYAKANKADDPMLMYLLSKSSVGEDQVSRRTIRDAMQSNWCLCCRPCHNAIHRTHDNQTLAFHFSRLKYC